MSIAQIAERPGWSEASGSEQVCPDPGKALTYREAEALGHVAEGLTAAATARRMGCSTSTVNKHLGSVYRKLGVGDRLVAVLEAQRRGLLTTWPDTSGSPAGR